MRKLLLFTVAALVAAFFSATPMAAQTETGQIVGTVTDSTGAVVPNAKVTIKAVGTGAERTATTSDEGNFNVANLLPGLYEVKVEVSGFAPATRRVQVSVGSRVPVDIQLAVGAATEVVEVTGEAGTFVNTETHTIGQVIDGRKITELPTLTRNPYDLIATAGNVSSTADAGLSTRGGGFNINGLRASSNNILLDGAANNDEFVAAVGQSVPLDSVQEFSVLTNSFTAEFGRAAGGVVNLVTKSGTNDMHGTAYWFGRYSALAANTFQNNANGIDKPLFTRNQFGYSVGGPVVKDKLFFFQSTEWIRVRSGANQVVVIPHNDLIAASAQTTQDFFNAFGALRSSFQALSVLTKNDATDPATGDFTCPVGGVCDSLPGTTNFFTVGQYGVPANSGGGDPQNSYDLVGRVDWNISNNTQLYGRYALERQKFFVGTNVNSPFEGFDSGAENTNNNFLISLTRTLTPRTVFQSKLVFNRLNNFQPLGANPVGPTLYMFAATAATVQGELLAFPGYSQFFPGNAIPFGGPQNFVQAYQDWSHQAGKHGLRFGGSYVYIRDNRAFGAYQEAVETLTTSSFGTGIENFLNGRLQQFQAAVDPQGAFPCVSITAGVGTPASCNLQLPVGPPSFSRSNRYHEFGVYMQDSWKLHPRFTLSLGVRWDYFGVQHNKDPKKDSNYYDAVGGSIFQNIRNGDAAIVPNSPIGGLWKKDWNNFGPRVGFAWDLFGDGKTSVRGGYGIGYERNFGNVTFNVIQNPPAYAVVSIISNVDVSGFIPITTDNAGPLAGTSGTKALPRTSLRNVDSNIRTAYAHLWSLSIEREFLKNLFVSVDYSGSKGEKLYSLENPNRPGSGNVYLGDPTTSLTRLRNTQYTNINRRGGNSLSLYNGLNARAELRNPANIGLTLRANYTWSHAIDNLSSTFSESNNNFNLGLLDPFDPRLDRGNADFDVRHRFALSGTWDLPFARNTSGVVNRIFHGWTIAPIFTARTGTPFTIFDCLNAFTTCPRVMVDGSFPREGPDSPPADPGGGANTFVYLDFAQFNFDQSYAHPLVGISDFGPFPSNMVSRNFFRGPGAWNIDLGVYKTTRITERFSVQVRAEFFNIINHSNLYVVLNDNEINSVAFVSAKRGVPPVALDERRNIQMALKLIF